MKDDKRVDINTIYNDLYQYCFDILVDSNCSWHGSIGLDEKTIRARYAYINGVSDTIRELDGMLSTFFPVTSSFIEPNHGISTIATDLISSS